VNIADIARHDGYENGKYWFYGGINGNATMCFTPKVITNCMPDWRSGVRGYEYG